MYLVVIFFLKYGVILLNGHKSIPVWGLNKLKRI